MKKIGQFATSNWKAIFFVVIGLCLAGMYAAGSMPSSVFPQTNFPRVTIMIDNGEMPADEMMATITKPIEEAMKDVPGVVNIRSNTGRGSSVVNVFFNWHVDMQQTELYVNSRLAQARANLPPTVDARAYRLTFSIFPIVGISLISDQRTVSELTVAAQSIIRPAFLSVQGVAHVNLVGSREPEIHVVTDPLRLAANHVSITGVSDALIKSNLVEAGGTHEEGDILYLTLVDGRLHSTEQIENLVVAMSENRPVRLKDVAHVEPGAEPATTIVTADGKQSVLIMIRSEPDGSTLDIVNALKAKIIALRRELPPDMKLAFFYDQSLLVHDSVQSVWEALGFGLLLSVVILFGFLKDWGSTLVATVVIPVTVLVVFLVMRGLGMSFNLMTLGGIAAAIGLVIDDAIVVVEAIHTRMFLGGPNGQPLPRRAAIESAIGSIFLPLTGSTLTPVVVFVPLAFLEGVPGVFFRALAITMTVSILMSLILAVTLTPALAGLVIRVKPRTTGSHAPDAESGGFLLRRITWLYEKAVAAALRHRFITAAICILLVAAGIDLHARLASDLLPELEERGFVLDYIVNPPGTSLSESNRALNEIEKLLRATPEVESYSRRTGVALGLELTEPNAGDFLVKLRRDSSRGTEDVMAELREKVKRVEPQIDCDFHGMLGDLIGDLVSSPHPVEIKIFSNDLDFLKQSARAVQARIDEIKHVTDSNDGLVVAGPSLAFRVRSADAQRFGLTAQDIAAAVQASKLGQVSSSILTGDRQTNLRVIMDPAVVDSIEKLKNIPLRTADGNIVRLSQVADTAVEPGQLELERDNLRQFVAVTAELEGGDLGSVMREVQSRLAHDVRFPPGAIEFGGLYQQQQESFKNLMVVLVMAILLIFTVLLFEFQSFLEPIAIVAGAVLALIGAVAALYVTGTSENIISRLGEIIGVGIVAKNGILMLDYVKHLHADGLPIEQALLQSGRRRLRPVLMTSIAAALGMFPLAYGMGSGADMLRPLAIAVIGALCISVLLSLVATPTVYFLLWKIAAPEGRAAK